MNRKAEPRNDSIAFRIQNVCFLGEVQFNARDSIGLRLPDSGKVRRQRGDGSGLRLALHWAQRPADGFSSPLMILATSRRPLSLLRFT